MKIAPFLLALTACDVITPPAEPPPMPTGCGLESGMFGACGPNYGCAGDEPTLFCLQPTDSSSICVPQQVEASVAVQACAAHVGALACSEPFGFCSIVCPAGHDAECREGMFCEPQTRLCVWPGGVQLGGSTGEPPANPTSTSTAATTGP